MGEEIRPSIGSVGDAYDALMESINSLYKAECIRTTVLHDDPHQTIADVEYATAGWVDWCNKPTPALDTGKTSRPSSTSKPTPLPSTESRTPYRNGREPGALHVL